MLDTAELADAQGDFQAAFLTQAATISRAAVGQSSLGGTTRTWANIATGVPCRVGPFRRQREQQVADQVQAQSDLIAQLPVGTDVTARDRIITGGVTYEVVGTDAGRAEALCLTAEVQKIGQG